MAKKPGSAAETPPADETPTSDDTAPATDGTADQGGTVPDQPQPEQIDGMTVEVKPPWFWMRSIDTGAFFPAYDLGAKADLEGARCEVSRETPPGMPAATGVPSGLLA